MDSNNNNTSTFFIHFKDMEDPRIENRSDHLLIDILFITVCGALCGAKSWNDVEDWANAKEEWLKKYIKLPNGIPSHDTFNRVFSILDPMVFEKCFINWVQSISKQTDNEIIAIDGKTNCGTYNKKNNKALIHMVSAWAVKNGVVLGQKNINDKSNEITAIPELLKLLEIKGCIVTIDAIGCQTDIINQIIDKKGDFVLAVKGNQGLLNKQIEKIFTSDAHSCLNGYLHLDDEEIKAYGRKEQRSYSIIDIRQNTLYQKFKDKWPDIKIIGKVDSQRLLDGKLEKETRYYIGSIKADIKLFSECVRNHWHIENKLHWTLDVVLREDECRKRKGYSGENFNRVRKIALNFLKNEKSFNGSIKRKMNNCSWKKGYLEQVLQI